MGNANSKQCIAPAFVIVVQLLRTSYGSSLLRPFLDYLSQAGAEKKVMRLIFHVSSDYSRVLKPTLTRCLTDPALTHPARCGHDLDAQHLWQQG
jgi:hypothetical protein